MIKCNKRLHFLLLTIFLVVLCFFLLILGRRGRFGFGIMFMSTLVLFVALLLFFVFTCIIKKPVIQTIHWKKIILLVLLGVSATIRGIMDNGDMSGACHAYLYYREGICDQKYINVHLSMTLIISFFIYIYAIIIERFSNNVQLQKNG